MLHFTDELREYAKSLFKTKPYHNPLTDIADDIDNDVNKLFIEKYQLEESHERLFSKTLNLESENKKLRELLQNTCIQPDHYCDKYGIEYEDRADAWVKTNYDIDKRLKVTVVNKTKQNPIGFFDGGIESDTSTSNGFGDSVSYESA